MSYLVLARKYRPKDFDSVSGQDHVTRTLGNAIKRNKVAHAFIFTGPRGVGKTSIARIFSRALNCVKGPTVKPCNECPACREILAGTSLVVREIDGASHNSVDNVRDLIDSFRSPPAPGYRYKVYIIDEVHMLSTAAFNALLKSLEEPPPFTVFILATTEVHKIPETVISRCHRHDFRALSVDVIGDRLQQICKEEKLKIEPEAVQMLARLADGSMRDAQSLLDRVQSFSDTEISAKDVSDVLGIVERSVLSALYQKILTRDANGALSDLGKALSSGLDIALFLREFVSGWRELLLAKVGGVDSLSQMGVTGKDAERAIALVNSIELVDLQDLVQLAREGADSALRSSYPRYGLEALLVRLAARERVSTIATVLDRLRSAISRGGGSGGTGGGGLKTENSAPQPQVRVVESARTAPREAVQTEDAPIQTAEGSVRNLSWTDFVSQIAKGGSQILVEQLKRLSVDSFSLGVLKVSAPDACLGYFRRDDVKAKLIDLLKQFSGVEKWHVELRTTTGKDGAAIGSLKEREKATREKIEAGKKETVANNPTVQSLKRLFPGTEIETIKELK